MKVGPTHYSGYTCEGCEYLKETTHWYCFEPSITKDPKIDNEVTNRQHTPNWCPYLRLAMVYHVMGVDEDYDPNW
jgi:hypothetical protein